MCTSPWPRRCGLSLSRLALCRRGAPGTALLPSVPATSREWACRPAVARRECPFLSRGEPGTSLIRTVVKPATDRNVGHAWRLPTTHDLGHTRRDVEPIGSCQNVNETGTGSVPLHHPLRLLRGTKTSGLRRSRRHDLNRHGHGFITLAIW